MPPACSLASASPSSLAPCTGCAPSKGARLCRASAHPHALYQCPLFGSAISEKCTDGGAWHVSCRLVPKDILNIQGALYFCTFFIGILNSLVVQPVAAAERTVFYRERAARMYSVIPYVLSMVRLISGISVESPSSRRQVLRGCLYDWLLLCFAGACGGDLQYCPGIAVQLNCIFHGRL